MVAPRKTEDGIEFPGEDGAKSRCHEAPLGRRGRSRTLARTFPPRPAYSIGHRNRTEVMEPASDGFVPLGISRKRGFPNARTSGGAQVFKGRAEATETCGREAGSPTLPAFLNETYATIPGALHRERRRGLTRLIAGKRASQTTPLDVPSIRRAPSC